jgi:hypothetical protein
MGTTFLRGSVFTTSNLRGSGVILASGAALASANLGAADLSSGGLAACVIFDSGEDLIAGVGFGAGVALVSGVSFASEAWAGVVGLGVALTSGMLTGAVPGVCSRFTVLRVLPPVLDFVFAIRILLRLGKFGDEIGPGMDRKHFTPRPSRNRQGFIVG